MITNKLYYGDNLHILREYIKDESIDLIYLDPPFNSKANYNILYKEPTGEQSQAQITAFEDTWHWTEEAERTFQEIIGTTPPAVVEMIDAFRKFVGVNDVMAYLTMMAIRLVELHRVLKDTGSIYLHCDPTASHYLKILMDTIFGCGTTIAVAQKLKRKWIGIDITHLAINLIKLRMKGMFGLQPKKDYEVIGEPEDLTGATELASQNRYQFQWWALSLIDAKPYQDKKKGSDTGIDGFIYFQDEKDKVQKVIVQVKSGHVSVKDIRDLGHVIDREGAEIGVFITLEKPTKPMITEAVQKGFYKSISGKQYPKLQIKTIEDLLQDNRLEIPSSHISHKKAQPSDKSEQIKLEI